MNERFLRGGLSRFLVNRNRAARMRFVIHSLAQNGFAGLSGFLSQVVGSGVEGATDFGTYYAFMCNDGIIGRASSEQEQQRCRIWLATRIPGAMPSQSGATCQR